jgi:uroporphyrinogen-III synthase
LPLLSARLAAAGIPLTTRVVYTTTVRRPSAHETASALRDLAAACFSSPSTVVGLCACAPPRWLSDALRTLIAVAPGHSTAAALREAGFLRIRLSRSPAASDLAEAARQGI